MLVGLAVGLVAGFAICDLARAETTTAYCLQGTMADGTQTRPGSLAHNGYALGTRLSVSPAVFGIRKWTVRDRIGWGTQADFWTSSCSQAIAYGRRYVRLTVGWAPERVKVGRVHRRRSHLKGLRPMIQIGTAIVCNRRGCVESP